MSASADRAPPPARSALGRLALAGALLLGEYLLLSFAVDAQSVLGRGGAWQIAGHAGAVGPLLLVVAAALVLSSAGRREGLGPLATGPVRLGPVLVHAALAVALGAVTWLAFGRREAPPGPPLLWLLALGGTALGGALTLYHALVGDFRWLGRALPRVALVGGALGVAAWLAGLASSLLWEPLADATFVTASIVLDGLGFTLEVDYAARVIGLEGFYVSVAPVCSGVEGIGLYLVLMTGFIVHDRATLRLPRALVLLPLGVGVVWLGNALRIAGLMVLGARVNAEVAVGSFHSKAGWALFSAITVGMALLARSSPLLSRREAPRELLSSPATPWVLPLVTWLGVGLVTSSLAEAYDPLYGLAVVAAGAVLWRHRAVHRTWLERPSLAAWFLGLLVGAVWLAVPVEGTTVAPGEGWSAALLVVWLVARVVGAVIVVPICEELAFRGFLARWLTGRDFVAVRYQDLSWIGIVASSVAFGLLHERWVLGVATGLAFALLVRQRGRLVDAVAAHAVSNLVIAAFTLATGAWHHW